MRKTLACLLLGSLLATPLLAQEWGTFAPQETALYMRVADVQAQVAKGPDNWQEQMDRMFGLLPARDSAEIGPVFEEFKNFFGSVQSIEFCLDDQMQPIGLVTMGPDSPKALSEDFQKFIQRMDESIVVTPTSVSIEEFTFKIAGNQLIVVFGETALKRLEETLAGDDLQSLSRSERFSAWSAKADGDFCLWMNAPVMQEAFENLDYVDRDFMMFMEMVEWDKWDALSLIMHGTPSESRVVAELTLLEPLTEISVFLKPAGSFDLVSRLPGNSFGFVAGQLGDDHQKTYMSLLKFFHSAELRFDKLYAQYQIPYLENEIADYRLMAEEAGPDDKQYYEEQIEYLKAELEEYKLRMESTELRPFMPDEQARMEAGIERETDAEEFKVEFERVMEDFGLSVDELLASVGNQIAAGILHPEYAGLELKDFESLWYAVVPVQGDVFRLRDAFLKGLEEQGAPVFTKKVEHGELIRPDSAFPELTLFLREDLLGVAGSDEVAERVLAAAAGEATFDQASLPSGAATGSKLFFMNVGAFVKLAMGEMSQREYLQPPEVSARVDSLLPQGLLLEARSSEDPSHVTASLLAQGEMNFQAMFDTVESNVRAQMAMSNDREALYSLTGACQQWLSIHGDKLEGKSDEDRKAYLANITPTAMRDTGYFQPTDGLRSAFDPQFQDAFQAVLAGERDTMGEDPGDLEQSGFNWYGMPVDIWPYNGDGGYWGDYKDMWLVAASREPWVLGGRQALIFTTDFQVVYLPEDVYQAMLAANREGKRLAAIPDTTEQPPMWKIKRSMRRYEWELQDLTYQIENYEMNHGKKPVISFNGPESEDANAELRKLLDIPADGWFEAPNARYITLECDGESFTARLTRFGQWIELSSEGRIRASWQTE